MAEYAIMSAGNCVVCPQLTKQIVSMKALTRFCLTCGAVMSTKTGEAVEPPVKRRLTILGEMNKSRALPNKLMEFTVAMAIQLETEPGWESTQDTTTIIKQIDRDNDTLAKALKIRDKAKIIEASAKCANGYMMITNSYRLLG